MLDPSARLQQFTQCASRPATERVMTFLSLIEVVATGVGCSALSHCTVLVSFAGAEAPLSAFARGRSPPVSIRHRTLA
jgi:hypothetical protein